MDNIHYGYIKGMLKHLEEGGVNPHLYLHIDIGTGVNKVAVNIKDYLKDTQGKKYEVFFVQKEIFDTSFVEFIKAIKKTEDP